MIKLKSLFRRGQGPSGSKQSGQLSAANSDDRLKKSSSVSSVDAIGVVSTKKSSTQSSTKTQLFSGSRDKLNDNYQPRTPPRGNHSGKERNLNKPSGGGKTAKQIVEAHALQQQQQHQQNISGNNNTTGMLSNDAALVGIPGFIVDTTSDRNSALLSNDFTNINFAGPIEVSFVLFHNICHCVHTYYLISLIQSQNHWKEGLFNY